ncbi:MAG: RNA methyltransferase [Pseudomonadales bacterium]
MPNPDYEKKKQFFEDLITLFGRQPVFEALKSEQIVPVRLHLADSNKPSTQLEEMNRIAHERNVEVRFHDRKALSRISKNGRQDQGVALDVRAPGYRRADELLELTGNDIQLVALDRITNPQNLGMIIRSVGASPMAGLLLARKGNAPLDGLVIKASAGSLFKARVYHCDALPDMIKRLQSAAFKIYGLDSTGDISIREVPSAGRFVFVLGNETHGLSSNIRELCDQLIQIPLMNDIESLNVSVAASLVSFRNVISASG